MTIEEETPPAELAGFAGFAPGEQPGRHETLRRATTSTRTAAMLGAALLAVTTPLIAQSAGDLSSGAAAAGVNGVVTCASVPATIIGTSGDDVLVGTDGDDVFAALGGDDLVRGLGGRDRICLGTGDDRGRGGEGNDVFFAEPTADGSDVIVGQQGIDLVRYNSRTAAVAITIDDIANDGQAGEQDNVRLSVENVDGTAFDDTLIGSSGANFLNGSSGNDDLRGGLGDDFLFGADGDDLLIGNAGNDGLSGFNGNDTILAAAVTDGVDSMSGGFGVDTVSYAARNAGDPVRVIIDGIGNDGSADEFDNVNTNIEHVIGGSGNDTLEVGQFPQDVSTRLSGGPGSDILRTIDGDTQDIADGGPSIDRCLTDPQDLRVACER